MVVRKLLYSEREWQDRTDRTDRAVEDPKVDGSLSCDSAR